MTERARSSHGRLRRPTLGECLGLIVAEGLVWLIGAVIAGYTEWLPLPWIIGAVMVLVLTLWVMKLRSSNDVQWGDGGDAGSRANYGFDSYAGGGDGGL